MNKTKQLRKELIYLQARKKYLLEQSKKQVESNSYAIYCTNYLFTNVFNMLVNLSKVK